MAKRLTTGRNEVGMLSDIKEIAETIGAEILGFPIDWSVEGEQAKSAKRPDIIIRRADGNPEVIASGEAKRPETPAGVHAYVMSEVDGAVGKAKALGGAYAFTTNFLAIALFDVAKYDSTDYLSAMLGDPIELIEEKETSVTGWWHALTKERRELLIRPGLEMLFAQLRKLRLKQQVQQRTSKDEVYLAIFKQSADGIINEALPAFADAYSSGQLPANVLDEAKGRGFDLTKADVVRYFVAQAVAEVLTSGLFYETVRPSFSLGAVVSGLKPSTSKIMLETIRKNLGEATKQTGDYETIFGLSHAASWVLEYESGSLRSLWMELFEALDGIRFEEVNSEILGVIFERLISADQRQAMGQHYTQTRLARAMTAWAIQDPDDTTVDFCAGGGTFLVEAYAKLREHKSHADVLEQVFGNDLDSFAVHLSTVNLATRELYKGRNFPAVSNRDGLKLRPGAAAVEVTPSHGAPYRLNYPSKFSVVLGNPPYDESAHEAARYRTDLAEIAGDGGVSVLPKGMPDNVNLAAWFILLAVAWLKPGGRIALVLPAAILQNEKHQTLISWIRARFDISVWHTESDVWFSDARVAPITLFMRERTDKTKDFGRFDFINVLEPVSGGINIDNGFPRPTDKHTYRDLSALPPQRDALIAGTVPEELLLFEASPNTVRLNAISDVTIYRGNKLGHKFYKLQDREPESTKQVRTLLGFDMPLRLNRNYLTPLLGGPKDEITGEFKPDAAKWWILSAPAKLPSGGDLEKYILAVKRLGVSAKPSVKAKGATWWSVNWKSSRIAIGAHPQFAQQVWWSDEPFVATDNFQAITLPISVAKNDQELAAAALASVFGELSALYRSNEVGCEGVRWVSTANVEDWHVLDWSKVPVDEKETVLSAYRAYRVARFAKLFEMTATSKTAWRDLSLAVAKAAGIEDFEEFTDGALKIAHSTVLRRREREVIATSGRTRAGTTGSAKLLRDVKAFTETTLAFRDAVDALSEGDDSVKLKTQEEVATLFDMDGEAERIRVGNLLTEALGPGFEAAPVWDDSTVELVELLFSVVESQFVEPGSDGEISGAFGHMAEIVRGQVAKSLALAVRKRLS
jgi:hypothetical protein